LSSTAQAVVSIDWVTVGDPGNACDTQTSGCFGSVADPYRISKFEVSNAQYAEFLNAVAATDTNTLYNTSMGSGYGGITRSGSSGSYSYSAIVGRESKPVNFVSFWDSTRFANWLHNGQPTGAQDNTTTEDGAYTLSPTGIANNTVTRNSTAEVFLPSEDEWYKAAYYDTSATSYFDYPAGSDTQTTCTAPGSTANTANCSFVNGDPTNLGSYTAAASPSGTFDQAGNVWERSDTISNIVNRGMRGGSFFDSPVLLAASFQGETGPTVEGSAIGFRVASPAPQILPAIGPAGLALLGALLGGASLAAQRVNRRRA